MQPSAKLKLQRVDYVQVASLKCSNSIQLLSAKGVKHQQKVECIIDSCTRDNRAADLQSAIKREGS
jgi:hypothetical protein